MALKFVSGVSNTCPCKTCQNTIFKIPGLGNACEYAKISHDARSFMTREPAQTLAGKPLNSVTSSLTPPGRSASIFDSLVIDRTPSLKRKPAFSDPFLTRRVQEVSTPSLSLSPQYAEGSNRKNRSHSIASPAVTSFHGDGRSRMRAQTVYQSTSTPQSEKTSGFLACPDAPPDIVLIEPESRPSNEGDYLPQQNLTLLSPTSIEPHQKNMKRLHKEQREEYERRQEEFEQIRSVMKGRKSLFSRD